MRSIVVIALAGTAAAAAPAHPPTVALPAYVTPGMTTGELKGMGLPPGALVADPDDPTIQRWDRHDTIHSIEGDWSFEFHNGRLTGYVFQPSAAIEDADHREPWSADHSCQMGFGAGQFTACLKAADEWIADLTLRYGKPAIERGIARRDDPHADRFVVAEPSCARAVNVVTATWATATARFRVVLWATESMGEPEYVWAFVVIGPHEKFEDASVKPVC